MPEAEERKVVHVCTACGNHTDKPCTDDEAVREYRMEFDPNFEGEGPAWWCEECL
jgi:hypothetical protein